MTRMNNMKFGALFLASLMLFEPALHAAQFVSYAKQNLDFESSAGWFNKNFSFIKTQFNKDWVAFEAYENKRNDTENPALLDDLDINQLLAEADFDKAQIAQTVNLAAPMPDGGPDQPEVQSFSPIDVSDMVDPFTGDFSYNIPLMDVDGYPLNIAYNAGVTMDQEASWVGLGWNLNPGVINRNLRGLPDDYNGTEQVVKEMNMRDNWTVDATIGADFEFFGVAKPETPPNEDPVFSFSPSLTLGYNNYNGWFSGISFGFSGNENNPVVPSLTVSGSSNNGAFVSPSLSVRLMKNDNYSSKLNVGTPWSSRSGMSNITIGYQNSIKQFKAGRNSDGERKTRSGGNFGGTMANYNLGMSTFTPGISMPTSTFGMTFNFKLGGDAIGSDLSFNVRGSYNSTVLQSKIQPRNAYGYMYHHLGQMNNAAMLDFNRENDGPFTKFTPALAIPVMTYDIFSVSGQGVGGSYRAVHNQTPYVFDAESQVNSNNGQLGFELNLGGTAKNGVNLTYSHYHKRVGNWNETGNRAKNKIGVKNGQFFFREASEYAVYDEETYFQQLGGRNPIYFHLSNLRTLNSSIHDLNGPFNSNPNFSRPQSPKRNQVVSTLTLGEMFVNAGTGQNPSNCPAIRPLPEESFAYQSFSNPNVNISHHIGEFTVLNTEGTRYVYGLPAYSILQKDVSFAVEGSQSTFQCQHGLIQYQSGDNSIANQRGKGHHYDAVTKPPFAHTYMLTTVLNSDYVDADNTPGPSSGDLGGYLLLNYEKVGSTSNPYKWRNPSLPNHAFYEEGMNSYDDDNKAHYMYGEKELWYVKEIRSKNHIAVFYFSDREDAVSVNGENGGYSANNPSMQKLDRIELYSLPDFGDGSTPQQGAVPIKTVHFEYDYSLCPGYHGNINNPSGQGSEGKLTLKKIYFTYENSSKGEYTAYNFEYNGENPVYNIKNVDKWGNYAQPETGINCGDVTLGGKRPWDFPYTTNDKTLDGNDKTQADRNASAWNLTDIYLPSGGRIQVDYESDDYAFVQHKPVHSMFNLKNSQDVLNSLDYDTPFFPGPNNSEVKEFFVDIDLPTGANINDYFFTDPASPNGRTFLYYRALMKMFVANDYEFVPGYMEVLSFEKIGTYTLRVYVKPERLSRKLSSPYVHPMRLAAINFARMYLPTRIPPSNNSANDLPGFDEGGILNALTGAFTSFGEIFAGGVNEFLFAAEVGSEIIWDKSVIRLKEPTNERLGGGHRVRMVKIHDSWNSMSGTGGDFYYGQEYTYKNENGATSGVAAYEPQMGGDENVWRQPAAYLGEFGAPNEMNFQTTPFGEQYFPTPMVGYSRVEIKNLERSGVSRTATGKVIHEFFTAKDYPTIVRRASGDLKKFKLPIFAIFFTMNIDNLSVSQGFVIETNNMHGKPKSQAVYQEGKTEPITRIEYFYQDEFNTSFNHRVLTNNVTSIQRDGNVSTSVIGVNFDAVADFRHSESFSLSISPQVNLNYTMPFLLVPMILGSVSTSKEQFRSSALVKVIERFGIQTRTVAYDLGSKVETTNLAWDSETGEVLVTKTKTNFEDDIYSFTYPAHWHYDLMGQAYMNVGKTVVFVAPNQIAPSGMGSEVITRTSPIIFNSGNTSQVNNSIFSRGDEVLVTLAGNASLKAWVTESSASGIRILNKQGQPISGTVHRIKILRSGRRNLQTTPIGSIVLRENPIPSLGGNVFDQVLQAGAVEYSDDWRTFCECFLGENEELYTTNPYVLGIHGTWRPKASYVHLAGRTQTFENQNSNSRDDGFFTSFTPFYRLENGKWVIDRRDWTYTSSVVEFSPFGQALETVDALDRYSSSMYGYNQTLPIAVAANTRYRQLGFDGFEDYMFDNCSDNHFRMTEEAAVNITNDDAHTGHYSLMVGAGLTVRYSAPLVNDCDETENVFNPCPVSIICVGELTSIPETNNMSMMRFVIQGGQGPYSFSFEVNNPQASYDVVDGEIIIVAPAAHFASGETDTLKVTLTVTDQTGCSKVFVLHNFICLPN